MGIFVIAFGVLFAALFGLILLLGTLFNRDKIGRLAIFFAFLTTITITVAVVFSTQADRSPTFNLVERTALGTALMLAIMSLFLLLREIFRPQRLKQSRGLLGIGVSLLITLSGGVTQFIAIYLDQPETTVRLPTPVNALANAEAAANDPCEGPPGGGNGEDFFQPILAAAQEETGLSEDELVEQLFGEGRVSVAELVEDNGGDFNRMLAATVDTLTAAIEQQVADGCITRTAATTQIASLPLFIRVALTTDFNTLQRRFDPDVAEISDAQLYATRTSIAQTQAVATSTPTLVPSATPTPTATNTATRTPLPTLSATPTRERYQSPTPTLTPTLPNPCLARANFNVNMRDFPSLEDTEVLLTIPFEAVFPVYASNEDQSWWYGQYEATAGWISAEFIGLTDACNNLPIRQALRR